MIRIINLEKTVGARLNLEIDRPLIMDVPSRVGFFYVQFKALEKSHLFFFLLNHADKIVLFILYFKGDLDDDKIKK